MRWIAFLMAGILLAALCIGPAAAQYSNDQAKIIVINLNINQGIVTEKFVEVRYGHAPNHGYQKGNFTATIRADNGTPLFVFDVWDPRNQFEDHEIMENNESCDLTGSMWHTDNVDIPVVIPYHPDIRSFELTDKSSRKLLVSVNVSNAVESFLRRFPLDHSLRTGIPAAPYTGTMFVLTGSVLALALLAVLVRLVRKS
jgi:hypothetical protein